MVEYRCFFSELLFHLGLKMSILPSQNPLLEMGEYKFQDLCRELLEKESDLIACRDYGERGSVPQHGADLIADCDDGISTVIGQCKCYKEFQPAKFRTVSTDFLDHLEPVWKPFRVKKFILLLGCDAVKTNQLAAIQTERIRFYEQGIGYEVWDKKHILSKLRAHPQIVQSYFKDAPTYWLENICGIKSGSVAAPPQATSGATLNISLITQIGKFSEIITGKQSEELERIKELHREGRLREAAEKLEKMRTSADEWALLDNTLKAKILKTLAVNALSLDDDSEKAKTLFAEALIFDPEGDYTTFKATLAYYEKGAKAALEVVENPIKTDELNQKIGFHLELNNPVAALELIENPPAGIETDAETKRLYALALFESEKIEDAWVKINQVEEEKPLWEMVKIAKAIVGYYSSVSAAAFPAHSLSWAMPVLWQLVKRDDESVTRLRNAEETFAQILESGNKHRDQKMIFESFRLACLANDSERQDEAAEYFQELLRENPAHPFVLAWAHVRGYEFDRTASRVALEVKLGAGEDLQSSTKIEETVALLDIYLGASETKKARRLLEKTRAEFEKVGGSAVYSYWLGRTAVVENKHDEALKIARSEKDRPVGRQIQTMVLRDRYFVQKSNKKAFKELVGYLEKCWNKTRDRQCLVELCYLNAENGHWVFIAENYEQFVESAGTGDAVRIAAYALNFAKQPTKCLQILEANKNKFPDSTLPAELLSLRLKSLTAQGNYSKAVAEAEALHQRQNTPESLLTLIEAQLQKGDVAGIVYNAQKILHLPDVEPKYVLRVAKIAALEDAELAKKLWRRVKDDILDDPELVRDALDIGFAIGLDAESRDLLARMKQYAEQSNTPFTTFSFKETLRQMQRSIKRRNQIDSFYGKGTLPLHFLAGENGFTLATMLHALPEQNRAETDLRRCAKILVRHGGRSMREGFFDVKIGVRLYMDVTAFMTATDLGILEKVEKLFAPIRVPAALPNALTAERQKLAGSHQLAEIVVHRRVLTALEKGKFELFSDANELGEENEKTYKTEIKKIGAEKVSLIVKAKQENSFVVEHLPLSDREAKQFILPAALAANVINCRAVAQNLLDLGHLSETEFVAAVDKLGIDGSKVVEEDENIFPPNAKLYLDDYMVNVFEKSELLDKVCEHYEVFADSGYIERIKGEIEIFERDEKTARWLQQAEKHLSEGFEKGTYLGISVEERQMFENSDILQNVDADSLAELLQLAPQPDAYIWIDDRSVNSHSHAAAIPIVTVTDMLAALQRDGALTDDEYFNHLLNLRAGNYRYIPITSEEILRHLRAAKIVNGKLVESDALSILRRYSAACLLDEYNLQKPPLPKRSPNIFGELNFALEMTGAVSDAIVDVWNKDGDLREASIRANWIFDNLYVGKYGVRRLLPSNDAADGDGSHEMGIDFSELLAKAVVMHGSQPAGANGKTRRQIYFDWLNDKFFFPRLKADPHVVASAAKMFKSFFDEHPRREFESSEYALASRLINADLFLDLPEQIAAEIKTDEAMLDWLGVSIEKYFTFGKKRFLSADFWTAAEKAMNDESAVVSPADSSKTFNLKRGIEQEGIPAIELVDEGTGKTEAMLHATLGILFRDREKRIECLKKNRHWFDCDAEAFKREVEEIASLADPRGRVKRANSRMRQSIVVYYEHLLEKFESFWNQGKKASMNPKDLETFPPDGLLRHYRLTSDLKSDERFAEVINDSATKLLKEEGLAETVERLSHLPLKMPESVTVELKKLSVEAQSKLFGDLIAALKSPLGKMQLVDLILRCASGDEKLLERAKILVGEIFDDERKNANFDLFTAILRFVGEEFGYLRETDDWAIPVKLAMIWAHAGKLFNLLLPVFGNGVGFRRWFWNLHQHTSTIFGEKSEYLHDCLHPRRISDPVFRIHGATALWAGNARSDLEFLNAFERIRKAIVFKDEIPQLELFRSPELSHNSTGSIFGGDRSEIFSRFFGEGNWDAFSNNSIKNNVFEALETLEKNQCDPHGWLSFSITVGNSPINRELRGKFVALIENLDFSALLDADLETAIKALLFIVPQTSILSDELKEKCEIWLFQLAKKIADNNVVAKNRVITEVMIDYGYKLLEIALTLSFRAQDAQSSGKKFKELMLGLLSIWKEFGAISETAIETLTLSLPLAQTQHLPEILLNIRASKPANLIIESLSKQKIDEAESD